MSAPLLIARTQDKELNLLPGMANRHGLITGATGTGKTVTLQKMALSFIFGPLRSVPMGVRVVTGISFGFVFYVLDQIFGPLTLVYGIPPVIGALLPSASFFVISLWLMMRKA